jgi:uncharacterized membrane protein YqjE
VGKAGNENSPLGEHSGAFDSLKVLGQSVLAILQTRLELLGTEIAEERVRLAEILLYFSAIFLALFLACLFLAAWVIASAWDSSYRGVILGGVTVLLFVISAVFLWIAARKVGGHGQVFAVSIDQIKADIASLQ